jgi:hypothetical protein
MLEALLSGGLTGIAGSLVSNITGYFKAKQDHEQAMDMGRLTLKQSQLDHTYSMQQIVAEAKYKSEQLTIESERDMGVAEYSALTESYKDQFGYSGDSRLLQVAEFINKVTRPVLTYALVFLTTGIYFNSEDGVRDMIARAVVAMTATVISWWFCDRQISKQISKKIL